MRPNLRMSIGRRDRFCIELEFLDDPDPEFHDKRPEALTWGGLKIWISGTNVCEHWANETAVDGVYWYLFPFLHWTAHNWPYLLHEQRLPLSSEYDDAWTGLETSFEPSPLLTDIEAEIWESRWHAWWMRHSLWACRDGGLFPDLFIRRYLDQIEFSWSNALPAGTPENIESRIGHKAVRLNVGEVEGPLLYALEWSAEMLQEHHGDVDAFRKYAKQVKSLRATKGSRKTFEILAGVFDGNGVPNPPLRKMIRSRRDDEGGGFSSPFFDATFGEASIIGTPTIAAMCRTLSPTMSTDDQETILKLMQQRLGAANPSQLLRRLARDEPLIGFGGQPHEDGYQLAESLHEATSRQYAEGTQVDIERLLNDLEVPVFEITLSDSDLRAIAVVSEKIAPFIAINLNFCDIDKEQRRFTLAHELCHILHDHSFGLQMAMASGSWAPRDVERRANAFAARFLMPYELTREIVAEQQNTLATPQDIWRFAEAVNVSFSASVHHLCNLGFMHWMDRDRLIESQIQSQKK